MTLDDLLKTVTIGTDAEAYKAMYELNSSALYEMTKDPHQVIKYSRILRQIQHLVGDDAYSFLFEAGKLRGYVEALEKMNGKQEPKDPIIMPDDEYDTPVLHASCPVCGSGLGHDIDGHKVKHISYCETCGQAIRWN